MESRMDRANPPKNRAEAEQMLDAIMKDGEHPYWQASHFEHRAAVEFVYNLRQALSPNVPKDRKVFVLEED